MEQFGQFILNHGLLWAAFIALLALTFLYEFIAQKKKAKTLTPQAVVDLINNEQALVIDLRDKETFKNGHIIDAINAQADDFEKPKLSQYKNKPIVLVCARGLESPAMAAKLRTQGYQPLILGGGIAAWQNAELPLIKGKG